MQQVLGKTLMVSPNTLEAVPGYRDMALEGVSSLIAQEAESKGLRLVSAVEKVAEDPLRWVDLGRTDDDGMPVDDLVGCPRDEATVIQFAFEALAEPQDCGRTVV